MSGVAAGARETPVTEAYICDFARTPIGRYGGALSSVRADDLGAHPIRVLRDRHASVDWAAVDEVIYGCANQAGEDNRNVGPHGGPSRRAPRRGAGEHDQPPVRLRARCGRAPRPAPSRPARPT
jgi:hypothetical protein